MAGEEKIVWMIKTDVEVNVKREIKSKAALAGVPLGEFVEKILTDFITKTKLKCIKK